MAFGASIRALLDTYANCVSLLKAFGRTSSHEDPDPRQRDHTYLRKALKSDRSLVKRAYSSKVSESGSRFKQGDARAIKALDRILKRLRNAIADLLRTSNKKDELSLDYGSLMSLSNASRQDALKAIDGLSRRLRSPTPGSVVSSSSTVKTSNTTKAQSRRKRKPPPDARASDSKPKQEARRDKSPSKKSSAAAKEGKAASKEHTSKTETERLRKRAPAPPHPPKPPSTPRKTRPSRAAAVASGSTHSPATPKSPNPAAAAAAPPPPPPPAATAQNRISMLSFSSDSTKLGEIPQRKWQRSEVVRYYSSTTDSDDAGDSTGYGVRPMFPLRPYTVEVKERRFLGWFSRRRET